MNFRILRFVFTLVLGTLLTKSSFAETAFRSGRSPWPKILVLIIANDAPQYYVENQKVWRSFMHLDREHVEAYFIKAEPKLRGNYRIRGDVIWSKTEENFSPGILNKTILSMEAMLRRIDEFDYVLRTNLSSIYDFPKLLDFLRKLPAKNCYCGINHYNWFASGAGFILSPDLVKVLVQNKAHFWNNKQDNDDVIIGHFLRNRGVEIISAKRMDFPTLQRWRSHDKNFSDYFHFRCKNDDYNLRLTEEITIQKELVKLLYGVGR
jgi:hypothetical protein